MSRRQRHADLGLYLPYAIAATLGVVVLPVAVVLGMTIGTSPDSPALAIAALGLALSIAGSALGSWLWGRRAESVDVSFGELMIWAWYRRRRAERKLVTGERRLRTEAPGPPTPRRLALAREQRLSLLHDLIWALEAKDPYMHGHSRRVRRHVRRMATVLGLTTNEADSLATAATLHDVGKIRVPDRVLRKPTALTIEEQVLLRDHTHAGAWMVASLNDPKLMLAVRHHHERWDGKGYPDGLAREEIPLFARVICVADAFDAMTSSRPYRASLGREVALDVIRAESGAQSDPEVVEAFVLTQPTRLPIPALVPLLAAPARWVRELIAQGVRSGSASLASAASAVGVTAVLGASIVGPPANLDRTGPTDADRAAVHAPASDASEDDASTYTVAPSTREKLRATHKETSTEKSRQSTKHTAAANASASANKEKAGKPSSKSGPQGADAATAAAGAPGDPQPDKGRDCIDHPGTGKGGGNDAHCPVE
ncbi:MAG: HD-GYP domain-containing protein [Actinomycetota bacterium]